MRELYSALLKTATLLINSGQSKKNVVPREFSSRKNDCYRSFPLYVCIGHWKLTNPSWFFTFHVSHATAICDPLVWVFVVVRSFTTSIAIRSEQFFLCADSCFIRSFFLMFLIGIDLIFWTSLNTHFKSFNIWIALCVVYFRISCNIGLHIFFTKKKNGYLFVINWHLSILNESFVDL